MKARRSRTVPAALLLVGALAALLVAWFLSGWADVRAQQRELEQAPIAEANDKAIELAHELRVELARLVAREAERPYFHYQNLFHDPRSGGNWSVAPSPLADGPDDALVLGHFQLDRSGRLTTPTINDALPELTSGPNLSANQQFRDAALDLVAELKPLVEKAPMVASLNPSTSSGTSYPSTSAPSSMSPPAPSPAPTKKIVKSAPTPVTKSKPVPQVLSIDPSSYVQNNMPDRVFWEQNRLPSRNTQPPPQRVEPQQTPPEQSRAPSTRSTPQSRQPASPQSAKASPSRPSAEQIQAEQKRLDEERAKLAEERKREEQLRAEERAQQAAAQAKQAEEEQAKVRKPARPTSPPSTSRTTSPPRTTSSSPISRDASLPPLDLDNAQPVTVTISPLEWRTMSYGGAPALVAVRQVATPDGNLAQGFVVDRATLATWLADHAGTTVATLATGDAATATEVAPGWHLEVAPESAAIASALVDASMISRGFVMRFVIVGAIALFAAAMVVLVLARAEKLANERSQFAAAAAHELRTPLAGLQLYGDMLADGLGDPNKLRDYAKRMSEEASRLGRVVSNVLGFSQLERGNLAVEAKPGVLGEALCELAERVQPSLDRAGAVLDLDVPPDLEARFDRDALARIVGNLLDNAEKYSRGAEDRTIALAARAVDDGVEVVVRDHGPGVSEATRGKLFRAFSRGVDGDGPAGLGLGLALSQSLARAMGGDLTYRAGDSDKSGAAFVLRLAKA